VNESLEKHDTVPDLGLRALAAAALRDEQLMTAYAATVAGLKAAHTQTVGHYLLLRARTLPYHAAERIDSCLHAALALARQVGDSALVNEALRALRMRPQSLMARLFEPFATDDHRMEADQVQRILERERQLTQFPETRARPRQRGVKEFEFPEDVDDKLPLDHDDLLDLLFNLDAPGQSPDRCRSKHRKRTPHPEAIPF